TNLGCLPHGAEEVRVVSVGARVTRVIDAVPHDELQRLLELGIASGEAIDGLAPARDERLPCRGVGRVAARDGLADVPIQLVIRQRQVPGQATGGELAPRLVETAVSPRQFWLTAAAELTGEIRHVRPIGRAALELTEHIGRNGQQLTSVANRIPLYREQFAAT